MRKPARCESILIATFAGLASLGLVAGPASAALVMLRSGDQIPGTAWEVIFEDPVTLLFNDADKTNRSDGTLFELTSRTNNDSITLTFQQIFETPTSRPAGGLRLNFQKTDTNVTGPAWTGYQLQLIDDVPAPNDPKNGDYPPQPHFHQSGPAARIVPTAATFIFGEIFTGDNLDKYKSSFKGDVRSRDPSDLIELGGTGNTVGQGQSVQILNLLIHEREFAIGVIPDPGRRIFRLVETPVIGGRGNPP
jgi:hypothetical protein